LLFLSLLLLLLLLLLYSLVIYDACYFTHSYIAIICEFRLNPQYFIWYEI